MSKEDDMFWTVASVILSVALIGGTIGLVLAAVTAIWEAPPLFVKLGQSLAAGGGIIFAVTFALCMLVANGKPSP